jgi:hypothetical protein
MEIQFEGSLTKEDYLDMVKLSSRPLNSSWLRIDLWLLLVSFGVVLVFGSIWLLLLKHTETGILLAVGVVLLVIGMKIKTAPRNLWKQNEALRAPQRGTVSDDAIQFMSSFGESRFEWAAISGFGEYKETILLFQSNTMVIPFPKRFFNSKEDWDRFRQLVMEKLPVSHQVVKLSLKEALIYLLIAVAIISLALQMRKGN